MLTVLYEDNHCLAVAKPAGLATQAPAGLPSLEALARAYLKVKYNKPGNVYLGIPHRLDRPVSGVVLFARQTASARCSRERIICAADSPAPRAHSSRSSARERRSSGPSSLCSEAGLPESAAARRSGS